MKKSFFRHAFDIILLSAFAYFGITQQEVKALMCLAVLLLLVLIEIGAENRKIK